MGFINEKDLEIHVRELLKRSFKDSVEVDILNHQTVGDIVIMRNGYNPAIFFLELKYYTAKKGRLGIGTGKGKGIQPEILALKPAYLATNMMWLLGTDTHSQDNFWLLSNRQICEYLSGGNIGEKQNNIQTAIFRKEKSLTESALIEKINRWVLNT